MTRVGFIGIGSQGGPMARRIADEGFPLTVWARKPEATEAFAGAGGGPAAGSASASAASAPSVSTAASPAALGAASDVVGICVVADADVEEVVLGPDGVLAGMAPGGLIAIHSTVHPDTCRKVATDAAAKGVAVIDAPVSGGGMAAAAKHLLVMVGGEAADVARARPVLEAFGDPIIHLGPIGSGQVAKLLNNYVFVAQLTLALETFDVADQLGLDRQAAAAVLTAGSGSSRAVTTLGASGVDLTGLRSATGLLEKDVRLLRDVLAAAGGREPPRLGQLSGQSLDTLRAE